MLYCLFRNMCYVLLLIFSYLVAVNCIVSYNFDIKGDALNGYYISTFVGTPPQLINMLIDTGSSNLAIASTPSKIGNARYFVYNQSLTFRASSVDIRLRYVEGYWSGFLALDVFNPCLEDYCSIICNISCMTSIKGIFNSDSKFEGIMGLAYSSIARPSSSVRPFIDAFIAEQNISNVFSLLLCGPYFSSKERSTTCGKFLLGHHSHDYIDGNIMYTPIVQEWFYEVTVIDIKVGGKSASVKCEELNRNKSIVDSGTTELNVPHDVYYWIITEIYNHTKNVIQKKFWINETVLCMKNESLNVSLFPSLTLTLYHSKNSSFDIHISPELYILPLFSTGTTCVKIAIGISSYGVVIGSSILKGFYVIFDKEKKMIGFAKPKFGPNIGFISKVSDVMVYNTDFDDCIRSDLPMPKDASISPQLILGLIVICALAIIFLYALLTWIWKFHVVHSDNLSDTSSLIDED